MVLEFSASPELGVYYWGDLAVEDVPSLIQSQTGCFVERRGNLWRVLDLGDNQVVLAARGEGVPVTLGAGVDYGKQIAVESAMAGLSRYEVCIVIMDVGAAVDAKAPRIDLDAYAGKIVARAVDGAPFSIRDAEEKSVEQYTVVGGNAGAGGGGQPAQVQSGLQTKSAGVIFEGSCKSMAGRWHIQGKLELSRFTTGLNKIARQMNLSVVVDRGEWVAVGELDTGSLSASMLKTWGLNASARRFRVWIVLR